MNIDEEKFIVLKHKIKSDDLELRESINRYLNYSKLEGPRNFKTDNTSVQLDRVLRKRAKFEENLRNFLNLVDNKNTDYDLQLENDEIILFVKKG